MDAIVCIGIIYAGVVGALVIAAALVNITEWAARKITGRY